MSSLIITSPHLYAITQGFQCKGEHECHWCGSPCDRTWQHDDTIPMIGVKTYPKLALRPGSHFICAGCWLFRRKRITVPFFGGNYKDGQCPQKHSWAITEYEAKAIRFADGEALYEFLLKPPLKFSLSILSDEKQINHLQLTPINDLKEIIGETQLKFTLNNNVISYTPYELEEALRHGSSGKEPGVREIIKLYGPYKLPFKPEEPDPSKRKAGRPVKVENPVKKKIS